MTEVEVYQVLKRLWPFKLSWELESTVYEDNVQLIRFMILSEARKRDGGGDGLPEKDCKVHAALICTVFRRTADIYVVGNSNYLCSLLPNRSRILRPAPRHRFRKLTFAVLK